MKLINGFVQSLKLRSSFHEIVDFLAGVSKDYKFRRQEVSSFIGKTIDLDSGKKKLIREKNGFFLVRETLLEFLKHLSLSDNVLTCRFACKYCGKEKEAIFDFTEQSVFSINNDRGICSQVVLFDPIVENVIIDGKVQNLWIHLDKQRRLRNSERTAILSRGYILVEMILTSRKKGGDFGDAKLWGVEQCVQCRSASQLEKPQINQESDIKLKEIENSQIDEREQKMKELNLLLERKIPFGDYSGKPFRWLIGFKEHYLEKLLVEMDPEEELRDYLVRVQALAEELEFDGYPDLLALKSLLERTRN